MEQKISLTGIKPTGTPHLGNFFGAIQPALNLTKTYQAHYFIADYHALNGTKDPVALKSQIYKVAATWLALGLDPEKALFYKQSDVPEVFELMVFLSAFTAKGLMNRAHSYKASVDKNRAAGKDPDHNVNMGLFTYPVLMSADILLFDPEVVPVGKDQKQHIEMACDIAKSVNYHYKQELLTIPEAVINEATGIVVGMDGRKMSKSYNNEIPIFLSGKKLRKLIMKITTNSLPMEAPKDPDTCSIFTLYKLFTTQEQQDNLRKRYVAGGMGWGHAKQELYEVMEVYFEPYRERYEYLMNHTEEIDSILAQGGARARIIASKKMRSLRKAAGFI